MACPNYGYDRLIMPIVEGKAPGSKSPLFEPFVFEPEPPGDGNEPYRVRHLIAKLVRETVRDFNLRERERARMVLTETMLADALAKGRVGSAREEAQHADSDLATGQALQAFEDGLYLLFVDDEEKRSLEEIVCLQPDTRITVIRLVALAGA